MLSQILAPIEQALVQAEVRATGQQCRLLRLFPQPGGIPLGRLRLGKARQEIGPALGRDAFGTCDA
jgi:hypothetical protein